VFERAVQAHGRDSPELWLLWLEHCIATQQAVGQVTWRATRELAPDLADAFAASCRELQACS